MLAYAEMLLKVKQQIVAGHDAAGEEVLRHPVGCVLDLVGIGEAAVREHMHEEQCPRPRPGCDPPQQFRVVPHVFKHLHRDDAIKPQVGAELIHVRSDDGEVREFATSGFGVDELFLRVGIRDRQNAAVGKAAGHEERERAPAAAKFQHVLAVFKASATTGQVEHSLLGFGKIIRAGVPKRATVLHLRPQAHD